jgi:peptide/nickel transport system substrate-binding protein
MLDAGEELSMESEAGVLRVQVDAIPQQLNPLVSLDVWCQRIALFSIFEPLVTVGREGNVQPYLASKMEVTNGGRHYLFTLRPGVTFHDGRPLTSDDVKYTLDKLIGRNPPSDQLKIDLADLEEVRASKTHTVELVLRRPNYLLPAVLADIGILPAHVYGRFGLRNPKLNWIPTGSGPFRVTNRASKETLTLERSSRYWGQRPRLERLVFIAIPDPARALAALRNNEVDILSNLYPGYYPDQVTSERLKERYRVLRLHPYKLRLILYNQRRSILRDRRLRMAIERLTDKERLVRSVRNNLGQILSAPLWPLSRWYDSGIHPISYDRAAAARFLDAAGWPEVGGGRREHAGTPLKIKILRARESAEMDQLSQILKMDLRAGGVEADIEAADFGFVRVQMKRGRFDAALIGLALRPESDLSPLLHSKGGFNLGAYSNPMTDALLDALRSAGSLAERQRTAQRLHRVLHEDPPFTVLYAPIELMVVHRRVKGLANNGLWPRLMTLSTGDARESAGAGPAPADESVARERSP